MKIRMGYVSNSSSSSFICYGVCLTSSEAEELLKRSGFDSGDFWYDMERWCDHNYLDFVFDEDDVYIGWIHEGEDTGHMPNETLSRQEMQLIDHELLNAGLTDEPGIYTGTRAC